MKSKRERIFEKVSLLYAIMCVFFGLGLEEHIGDVESIGTAIGAYIVGMIILHTGYDLWIKDNDLEEDDD